MMPAQVAILAEVTDMLRAVRDDIDAEVTMDTTFREDLGIESIEIVALAGRLQARYGNAVNLAQFVAGLDLASIRDLRVGELVDYIAAALDPPVRT
ncbi:acyl carrier protein [Plantactinospora sp. ZYX-F-223]|uniref:acyl carrier protein n=1 Tax=Plantactinospora sp. ZYX-F-223 TaxID=3144103 RepID=UPI0031FD53CC